MACNNGSTTKKSVSQRERSVSGSAASGQWGGFALPPEEDTAPERCGCRDREPMAMGRVAAQGTVAQADEGLPDVKGLEVTERRIRQILPWLPRFGYAGAR